MKKSPLQFEDSRLIDKKNFITVRSYTLNDFQ